MKKAILRDNTLSIIIAVVGLLLLFAASWMIYNSVTTNESLKRAQAIGDKIEAKVNALADNEETETTIVGTDNENPWLLIGWDTSMENRPDKCSFESCICICQYYSPDSCQNNGICRKFKDINKIIIPETFVRVYNYDQLGDGELICKLNPNDRLGIGEKICGTQMEAISLPNKLTQIKIQKIFENNERILNISVQNGQ